MSKFNVVFSVAHTKIGWADTEVHDDGDVILDLDECLLYTTVDELEELVKDAREFIEKRKKL